MSTQAIGSTNLLTNLNPLQGVLGINGSSQSLQTAGPARDPDGDSGSISPVGQLLSQLQQLAQQDPTKLKQVLGQIASQLTAAAQQGQGGQNQFLNQLASQFQNAAQTGDVSGIQPARGGHHHHHAHKAYQQAQQSSQPGLLDATQNTGNATGSPLQTLFSGILQTVTSALTGP